MHNVHSWDDDRYEHTRTGRTSLWARQSKY
jgi:hypothetical protein